MRDVAYPKELQERMEKFLEERLYQGMTLEEKEELKQFFMGKRENRAMEFMLQIENDERSVLKRRGKLISRGADGLHMRRYFQIFGGG